MLCLHLWLWLWRLSLRATEAPLHLVSSYGIKTPFAGWFNLVWESNIQCFRRESSAYTSSIITYPPALAPNPILVNCRIAPASLPRKPAAAGQSFVPWISNWIDGFWIIVLYVAIFFGRCRNDLMRSSIRCREALDGRRPANCHWIWFLVTLLQEGMGIEWRDYRVELRLFWWMIEDFCMFVWDQEWWHGSICKNLEK